MARNLNKIVLLMMFFGVGIASPSTRIQETLPTYHWAYEYINQLWLRGYFQELSIFNLPFTRGDIAKGLIAINKEREKGLGSVVTQEQWLINHLEKEFQTEITDLRENTFEPNALIGSYLDEELSIKKDDFSNLTRLRSRFSLAPTANITVFNAIAIDNRLDDDPKYLGKRQSGIAGFTEQAYMHWNWKKLNVLVGRDFIRWGAGESATLLISDPVRPMDLFKFSYAHKRVKFSFFVAMLDAFTFSDSVDGILRGLRANRYLAAHRFDIKISSWFNLSFTESILFGGVDRNFEFAYLNPFLFYHGNLLNGPDDGNTIGTIDWALLPGRNFSIYGTFMIDDIQLEKSEIGDLEPNELGLLFGLGVADPFNLKGSDFLIEYTRITNRTYKTPQPYEKFLHRNFPIGHYLGNDFDRWHLQWKQWIRRDLQITTEFEHIRKGEGDVYAPFDTPWQKFSLEEGFNEPFPTGIVETTRSVNFRLLFHPYRQFRASLSVQYWSLSNFNHISDLDDDGWNFRLHLWWAPEIKIPLRL